MKKRLNKAVAMGMVFAMAGSTMAFAQDTTKMEEIVPISAVTDSVAATEVTEAEKTEAAYIKQDGKIVSSTKEEDGSYQVEISNENGGLRFMVAADIKIINRADGTYLTADKLVKDMEISVIYGAMSPMGMSMPPFLGQVTAVVANVDKGSVSVGLFDQELTNTKDLLKLNIADTTNIQNLQGSKIRLVADDVKGKNAVVFYDATTKSIPAQTAPSFILILDEAVVDSTEAEVEETVAVKEIKLVETPAEIALRDKAEEMGFTVTWQGKDKAILVEKDEMDIEIMIGSAKYVVDEKEMTAATAARLVDGVLIVSAEVLA